MLSFRLAVEKDLENILGTYNSVIASRIATADLEPQSMKERRKWFLKHQESARPVWVIENEAGYIGWMSFSNFYGRPAYSGTVEFSLYLEAVARGKGFGGLALAYALEQARKLGIRVVLAYVFGHNAPSKQLFQKQGFALWGNFSGVALMEGIERDLIIYGLRLN